MALIDCAECGRQVSDKASSCPGCGAPITPVKEADAVEEVGAVGDPVTTVQETSKVLKAQTFIALVIFLISFGIYMVLQPRSQSAVPAVIGIFAGIWYLTIKIKIWWHHG